MHIINYTSDPNGYVYVAPRVMPNPELVFPFEIHITDEERNVIVATIPPVGWDIIGNYMRFSFVEQLVLTYNRFYSFKLISETTNEELYRGKIYCTDQTDLEKFSINDGQFTYYEDTDNDNQYIYR